MRYYFAPDFFRDERNMPLPHTETDAVTEPLSRASSRFNSVLTCAQGFALIAIAVAALVGICSAIWSMVDTRTAGLGDLLLLFLYIEILSMVKGSALGTREIPIRTPVALAIVAVARYIVVDVEHMSPTFMLLTACAILVLVMALWVLSKISYPRCGGN